MILEYGVDNMNNINQKAFTLIEMLVVIIIIGIILAIAIPSVRNITNQNKNKIYQTHMEIVEVKTKLLMDQYKGELLSKKENCFQIDYQELLKNEWITEQGVFCNGSIIITKSGNQKSLSADYYLSCVDKNNNSLHEDNTAPSGCATFKIS